VDTYEVATANEEDKELAALKFDVFARSCPARSTLEHVTGRWGILVLGGLDAGPMRFNALLRRVEGVSEKMLAQALQVLRRDGFVHREVHAAFPPNVEYSLTPLGRETAAKVRGLIDHLEAHMPQVLTANEHYDQQRLSGWAGDDQSLSDV
jgi:DNA-binding HxlR family transcriptional regulator